jgi:AhpD family alkylhydroperoxidase
MEPRMNLEQVAPEAMNAMLGLEMYVRKHVAGPLLHLVKLRASILNGCAYCVDMHSADALRAGEPARRLFGVAWRESPFFSAPERAALALTDAVTSISVAGVPDEAWAAARAAFAERELADLVMAIVTINAWNRLAISTHAQPAAEPVKAA